jgi:hypothetical protein
MPARLPEQQLSDHCSYDPFLGAFPVKPSIGCPCTPKLACTSSRTLDWDALFPLRLNETQEECQAANRTSCPRVRPAVQQEQRRHPGGL